MLSMKLADITNNVDGLWKLRDSGKIAESLAKFVNCMKDLMHLAKRHGIENKLYHGDGIDRIYKLIADKRLTRWISQACDNTWEGEVLWLKMIEFLEKDQNVNQQKALLQGGNLEKKQTGGSHEKRQTSGSYEKRQTSGSYEKRQTGGSNVKTSRSGRHYYSDDHIADKDADLVCAICGAKDHVATNGPAGTKIIQYFTCRKFVEMSPTERFNELRRKGLCFQCLYPGAMQNVGKHKDGKCQHDFVCQNPMHDHYHRKMHVLVCELHKVENEDLL